MRLGAFAVVVVGCSAAPPRPSVAVVLMDAGPVEVVAEPVVASVDAAPELPDRCLSGTWELDYDGDELRDCDDYGCIWFDRSGAVRVGDPLTDLPRYPRATEPDGDIRVVTEIEICVAEGDCRIIAPALDDDHEEQIYRHSFDADGKRVALLLSNSGYSDGRVVVFDVATGKPVTEPLRDANAHDETGYEIAFLGSTLLWAEHMVETAGMQAELFRIEGKKLTRFASLPGRLYEWGPVGGNLWAFLAKGPEIQIWDVATGKKQNVYTRDQLGFAIADHDLGMATRDGELAVVAVSAERAQVAFVDPTKKGAKPVLVELPACY